jgi:hypothetical protein
MTEPDVFETRLRAAIRRHVEDVPGGFDAVAFARMVVVAEPRHQPGISARRPALTLGRSTASLAWLALLAALLVALAVGLVAVGDRPTPRGWQRLDLPGGGAISDVVRGPGGFAAVGLRAAADPSAGLEATIWHSTDARSWVESSMSDAGSGCQVSSIAAGATGYVAVGELFLAGWPGSVAGPCFWVSSDGDHWTRVADAAVDRSPAAAGLRITDVAAIHGRFVAVGWYDLMDPSAGGSIPAIWTSTDGRAWQAIEPLDGASPGFFGDLTAVIEGGPGLVAIGEVDAGPRPAAWVSTDGLAWRRAPVASEAWPVRLFSIARGPEGRLVAFGRGPGDDSRWLDGLGGVLPDGPWTLHDLPWASTDGLSWTPAADLGAFKPSSPDKAVSVHVVAGVRGGFVAVGTESRHVVTRDTRGTTTVIDRPTQGVVWFSKDGLTWTRLRDDPALADRRFDAPTAGRIELQGQDVTWWLPFVRFGGIVTVGEDLVLSGYQCQGRSDTCTLPAAWVLEGGAAIEGPP